MEEEAAARRAAEEAEVEAARMHLDLAPHACASLGRRVLRLMSVMRERRSAEESGVRAVRPHIGPIDLAAL